VPNFASFLRVTCMRYLRRRLSELESKPALRVRSGDPAEPLRMAVTR